MEPSLRSNWNQGPWIFKGRNMTEVYPNILTAMALHGERSSPRGQPTRELLHAVTRINRPRERVFTIWGRNSNPFFSLAEVVWILTGSAEARWICYYNSRLKQVLDPEANGRVPDAFHAPYGERLRKWGLNRWSSISGSFARDQLFDCYHTLCTDLDSRQAVMTLWNPDYDHPYLVTKDRPCNVAVTFKVREGQLFMSVFNRSNDLVYGLSATNQIQFSFIQEVLASWLDVEVGPYTHYSDSLHLYERDPFTGDQVPTQTDAFGLYESVRPIALEPSTPEATDTALFTLLRYGDPLTPLEVELDESLDPAWSSIAFALRAFRHHKEGNHDAAVDCVLHMDALDWQVECARWLTSKPPYADHRERLTELYRREYNNSIACYAVPVP